MSGIVYLSDSIKVLKSEVSVIHGPTIPNWFPENNKYSVDNVGAFIDDGTSSEAIGIQYEESKLLVYVPVAYAFNIIR